jgi:hypothetical protein
MKIEKLHLCGSNSVCAGVFQLLRGRTPAQLRGNTDADVSCDTPSVFWYTMKYKLCTSVSVKRQPGVIKNQNPCDCDYFKSTTMRKASPEMSAVFWVTAQGSTHFTVRKFAGDHNSATSFP